MTTVQRRGDLPSVRRDLRVPVAVCVCVCVSVRSSGINLIYNHSPEIYPTVYKHRAINENEKRKAYLEAGLRSSSANVRESVTFYPAVVGSRAVQEEELESASLETCVSTFVYVCVRAQYVN